MWGRRMHLAIKAYQELLLTLVHMEGSKGDTVREAGKILMSGVFYEPKYMGAVFAAAVWLQS